jgi:7,8-dihydroneopterin aldolase/epimerase/oxygenase
MDITYIRGLKIDTVIGIYDWEREIKQTVSLDLDMGCDIKRASATEDLQYTLDYEAISNCLIDFVEGSAFQLIETMAEQGAALVMARFNIPWIRFKVSKPGAITAADDVGVIIERGSK